MAARGGTGRSLRAYAASFAALCAVALLSCDTDDDAFGPGDEQAFHATVRGRVLDRAGKPLSGAVAIALPGGASASTGSDGRFVLGELPPGRYRVLLRRAGFRDTAWSDSIRPGLSDALDLGDLAMTGFWSAVAGTVVDSTGRGAGRAGVVAYGAAGSAVADASGRFLLSGVAAGPVRLVAVSPGAGWGMLDVRAPSDDTLEDARIGLAHRGGTLVGRIAGSDGRSIAGATVSGFGGVLSVTTSSDGSFRLDGVPAGIDVALAVATPGGSLLLTGARADSAVATSLGVVAVPASAGTVRVLPGLAVVFVTDSVATLVAGLDSRDSTFAPTRWTWSFDNGREWDTTATSSIQVRPGSGGWTEGARTVLAKVLSSDGRTSAQGRIVLRISQPPDRIPPVVERLDPSRDSVYDWKDSVVAVSWRVRDDHRLDSVIIGSVPAWPADGVSTDSVALSVGRNVVRLRAIDSAGNVAEDSLVLVRRDGMPPSIRWLAPSRDTAFSYRDSVVAVSWSVRDDRRLDSVRLLGEPVEPETTGWKLGLRVGRTVLRMWAKDSAGNVARDSLVLTRRDPADTTAPSLVRGSPSKDTVVSYRDTALLVSWTVSDNKALDTVRVGGVVVVPEGGVVARRVALSPGRDSVVRIAARDASGNEARDSLRVARAPAPDTLAPRIARRTPGVDTAFSWADSLVRVAWSVRDDGRIDSAYVGGVAVAVDTLVSRRISLRVGTDTIRLRVVDAQGHVARDSLVLTRRIRPYALDSALGLLKTGTGALAPSFHPDTLVYRDTVDAEIDSLLVQALPLDANCVVTIGGVAARSRRVPLGARGTVLPIRVLVRAGDGDTLVYRIDAYRRFDTTWGVAVLASIAHGAATDGRDGRVYRTVRVGGRTWMAENLAWKADSSWCPSGGDDSCAKYGRLYAWGAASGSDGRGGACPAGWHLPSDSEWGDLSRFVQADPRSGGEASVGTALKATGGWGDDAGTDLFGFRALPGGYRNRFGILGPTGQYAHFWTATATEPGVAAVYSAYLHYERLFRATSETPSAYSVRCVEDVPDTSTALASLSASRGRLFPAFHPDILVYDDTVGVASESLVIAASATSSRASVAIEGGGRVAVVDGSVLAVTVANGARARTYRIRVFRDPDSTHGVPWNGAVAYGVVRDARDGKEYRTVVAGGRRWMAENLDHAVDSSWCLTGDPDSCARYGRLYSWSAAMGLAPGWDAASWPGVDSAAQGVCPSGWRMPSDADWVALETSVEADARIGAGKSGIGLRSLAGWGSSPGLDVAGMRLLPGGYRYKGSWYEPGTSARHWTATGYSTVGAWSRGLLSGASDLGIYTSYKSAGFSVRCVEASASP